MFVGPNSVLEGCQVENQAFIGMGATVREGSKICANGVVAAGSVIPQNTTV